MKNNLKLSICEYGEEKRSYSDTDYDRFIKISEGIIIEHLKTIKQRNYPEEVKNVQINIHLYTQ